MRPAGALGMSIIWHPLKLIFLKLYPCSIGLANILEHECPKCRLFLGGKFFFKWKQEFNSSIFPIIPVMSWHPRQLPGWPTP